MSNPTDVMIDIETLGLEPGCGVWQIGAVTDAIVPAEFSVTIDPLSCSGWADLKTIDWQESTNLANWEEAKAIGMNDELDAVKLFVKWLDSVGCDSQTRFWSKGNFDFPILADRFHYWGIPVYWHYQQVNDMRTLMNVLDSPMPKFLGAHNALEDARHQMVHLQRMLDKIEGA